MPTIASEGVSGPEDIHNLFISQISRYAVTIAVFMGLSLTLRLFFLQRRKPKGPLLFSELSPSSRAHKYITDCASVVKSAYTIFKRKVSPFVRITTEDGAETVIVDARYLQELKNLPDDALNFDEAVKLLLASSYSRVGKTPAVAQHSIRADLTPSIPRLLPTASEEGDLALARVFPTSEGQSTPVALYPAVLSAVAQVSARMFVGEPLCRDPTWLKLSAEFATTAFLASNAIKQWKPWARPFVYRFLPRLRDLERTHDEAIKLLMADADRRNKSGNEKRDDMTAWIGAKVGPRWMENFRDQAEVQLNLTMVAIHTTSMALTHMLYDLAIYPEHVQPLRDEVRSVLAESDGAFSKETIANLVKLDSFMKESQRLNPPALTTFRRRCMRDITLSDGTLLPKGTILEVDGSQRYQDPELLEHPEQFDGFRFYRLREQATQASDRASSQFAASTLDSVFWGQGKHACPGRFFAANEIKVLLAKIIMNYDIALEGGGKRPENLVFGSQITPNPTAQVLITKRKTEV